MLCLFHLSFFLVKRCIFDRGTSAKGRSLKIWWLCGIKVSDPYDIDNYVNKVRAKNRMMRKKVKELAA